MKRSFLLVPVIIIFSVSFLLGATTGKIAGIVKDARTGEPLPGVNIVIAGNQMGAATDIDGNYFIINISPGVYEVVASMMGYKKITMTDVRVSVDHTTPLDFKLETEVIVGEEVIVVAEKPVVDKYVTSSLKVVNSSEIQNSYVTNVQQVVDMQQGVNYMGGIRGGFGNEVVYYVDGMEMRETGSNSNYTGINTSAIEEMDVLTGGFNAEYGRAMGAVVNLVTKRATDRIHGSVDYRFRPAGIYHWGGDIYGEDCYEYKVMSNPDYWEGIKPGPLFNDLSNEEKAKIWTEKTLNAPWMQDTKNYDKRHQHEVEATLYGPINNKLSFMLSGRYTRGAPIFPSIFKYEPDWNGEANLYYDISSNTTISLKYMHAGYDNSGQPRSNYASSEDVGFYSSINAPYVTSALSPNKYYLLASWGLGTMKPPEYVRINNGYLKLTHTFTHSTFLEVKYNFSKFDREASWRRNDLSKKYGLDPIAMIKSETYTDEDGNVHKFKDYYPEYMQFDPGGMPFLDKWTFQSYPQNLDLAHERKHSFSADLTSQLTRVHQLKTGVMLNLYNVDRYLAIGPHYVNFGNGWQPGEVSPYEAAAYIQDRIETKGMVINLGVRLDLFNANTIVSDDIYDPAGIDKDTPGNIGQSYVSRGNPWRWERLQEGDPYSEKTPTQVAISPRIGISHPISENTVLHFMYGHFNQRPAWVKIVQNPALVVGNNHYLYGFDYDNYPWPEGWLDGSGKYDDKNNRGYYFNGINGGNPWLDYEKVIQYEVGFEQNILDKFLLDATMYYKDGKNLTSAGIVNAEGAQAYYGTISYATWGYIGGAQLAASRSGGTAQAAWKTGQFYVPQNSFWQDVRGIEISLESRFKRFFNARVDYMLSFSKTGMYGIQTAYRPGPDGTQFSYNTRWGANKGDGGNDANNNEYWNPNNSLKFAGTFFTPENFGPALGQHHIFSNWNLTLHFTWAQGRRYTYHSLEQGDFSTEPLNRRWKDFYNTNLSFSKKIKLTDGISATFSIKVINLFNNKQLRLPSNLADWHERGIHNQVTIGSGDYRQKVDDVWRWYNFRQLRRQIFYNLGFEF